MPTLSGIGFDLDHTLAIDNELERVAFLRLLELVLERGGHALGTLADENAHIVHLLHEQRSGAFSIADAVRGFVAERGVPADDYYVERFQTMAIEMVADFVIPLPGVKRTLETLRQTGLALAILSNGWNPLQTKKAERADFTDQVLASADIGAQKPSSRAFDELLRALGTPAGETWYVGDDPYGDISGAHASGLSTVWMNWEGKQYPADVAAPTYRIGSFEELLRLIPWEVRVS
jgi:HAD superfamily hydrolase (TIGR01509 family)